MSISRPTSSAVPASVTLEGASETLSLLDVDVVTLLRSATAVPHQQLEAEAAVIERAACPVRRGALVRAFHALHAAADAALAPVLGSVAGLDYARRRRLPLLEADLRALAEPAAPVANAAAPTSPAEAMGMLYVLEGSTLGARIIRGALAKQGAHLEGLSFLDPYGPDTGQMWRSFLTVLRRVVGEQPDGPEAVVRGGLAGFALAREALA